MHPEMKPQRCHPSPRNDVQYKETGGIFHSSRPAVTPAVLHNVSACDVMTGGGGKHSLAPVELRRARGQGTHADATAEHLPIPSCPSLPLCSQSVV